MDSHGLTCHEMKVSNHSNFMKGKKRLTTKKNGFICIATFLTEDIAYIIYYILYFRSPPN